MLGRSPDNPMSVALPKTRAGLIRPFENLAARSKKQEVGSKDLGLVAALLAGAATHHSPIGSDSVTYEILG
jgi:hypothetical protein